MHQKSIDFFFNNKCTFNSAKTPFVTPLMITIDCPPTKDRLSMTTG